MKKPILALGLVLTAATAACAQEASWPPVKQKESEFTARKLDTFTHGSKKEWGYAMPQRDTFLVLHPKQAQSNASLYVVLHSAGHDVHSCLACTTKVGNHDIYHSPPDFFALYLDCKANNGDWWWGINKYPGPEVCPTEKRVIDTVKWVIKQYGIDANRVYLCGNSMGGSGTLGIGMRHGDVFAAIKANVPAEVKHVSSRMYFPPQKVPADVMFPDPPIVVDYSAQNDGWSRGHDAYVKAMNERKYALFLYWGPFGHANNHANIMKVNDLINSFDWLSVKKNESYPVFTDASSNDPLPWPDQLKDKKAGQINAFFRWKNVRDTPDTLETTLFLVKPAELKTTFTIPAEATADVSLRRLQKLRIAPGALVRWTFGKSEGEVRADAAGCVTIPRLKITVEPTSLTIKKAKAVPTKADLLRGEYGPYRANNDLLYYHLDVRVDPDKKTISGKNTIRFKMLKDDNRVQFDLHAALAIDKIVLGDTKLKYERDSGAVFVDFPEMLKAGRVVAIDFYYSGTPEQKGRFGGFTFGKDPQGRPWIYTSCEGQGASVWWPNKDQWRDKVESMDISVAIPNGLVDVSNGKFVGKKDLGDGYTRWDWHVHYPINNYNVSLNIGAYEHFSDKLNDLDLDFYALPEDLDRAKKQFAQAKGMLEAFQHYFGEYPFKKDGYKLIQVPYSGMEHQSAVTYGNGFKNGYLGRDWTGVGINPRFDFIIIHESGHEWFGNSVSAADRSDMWIHEGWTTYLESLYVEHRWGKADAIKYLNGYKKRVQNRQPIVPRRGINANPPGDQYFKGALFIHTLRSVVNDDQRWWKLIRDFYQHFQYQTIMTEDVVEFFNKQTGKDLTPIFDQYLRHAALPVLELKFDDAKGEVAHRWKADEKAFAMPIRVGMPESWQTITPTADWQSLKSPLKKDQFQVATDLYYVVVRHLSADVQGDPRTESKEKGKR